MTKNIRKKYNKTGNAYVKREESCYQFHNHKRYAENYLKNNQVDLVIDIGCGTGVVSRYLAHRFSNVEFIGIDFSENLLTIAKNRSNEKNIKFILLNFEKSINGLIDDIDFENKKILILVLGPMEYYAPEDRFTDNVVKLWSRVKKGAFVNIMLNDKLIFRRLLKKKNKKYWHKEQAINLFSRPSDKVTVRYYSFLFFDLIITKFLISDIFFLLLDKTMSIFAKSIYPKFTTNFEIFITRSDKKLDHV